VQIMKRSTFAYRSLTGRGAVIVVSGSAVALPVGSSPGTVFRGCLSQFGGLLHDVASNPGQQLRCLPRDQEISWNQTGPPGREGPAGPKGDTGPVGLTGLYRVSGTFGLAPGATTTEEKACNPGDEVYGGGAYVDTSNAVVKTLRVYAPCGPKA
jgi:hypothetical protein